MSTIRSLVVKVGADLTDMQKGFKQASKNMKTMGKNFTNTGKTLTKGLTVPVLAVGVALGKMVINAGKAADALNTLSNQTGISTERLQGLEYASRFVDVSVETMAKSQAKLTKAMDDARKGSKDYEEAFQTLGVSITNTDGSFRDSKVVWEESITALGNVANETERDATAMRLFGKSFQELNPLIKAGVGVLDEYAKEAEELGLILSEDEMAALQEFDDKMQMLQASFEGATKKIGIAFLPVLESLVVAIQEKVIPAFQRIAEKINNLITWYSNLDASQQGLIRALGIIVVAMGPVLTVFGKMFTGLSSVITVLGRFITKATAASVASGTLATTNAAVGASLLSILAPLAAVTAAIALMIVTWDEWVAKGGAVKAATARGGKLTPEAKDTGWYDPNAVTDVSAEEEAFISPNKHTIFTNPGEAYDFDALFPEEPLEEYKKGTNFVPEDGPAILHQGEAVLTAEENRNRTGGTINVYPQSLNEAQVDYLFKRFNAKLGVIG